MSEKHPYEEWYAGEYFAHPIEHSCHHTAWNAAVDEITRRVGKCAGVAYEYEPLYKQLPSLKYPPPPPPPTLKEAAKAVVENVRADAPRTEFVELVDALREALEREESQ